MLVGHQNCHAHACLNINTCEDWCWCSLLVPWKNRSQIGRLVTCFVVLGDCHCVLLTAHMLGTRIWTASVSFHVPLFLAALAGLVSWDLLLWPLAVVLLLVLRSIHPCMFVQLRSLLSLSILDWVLRKSLLSSHHRSCNLLLLMLVLQLPVVWAVVGKHPGHHVSVVAHIGLVLGCCVLSSTDALPWSSSLLLELPHVALARMLLENVVVVVVCFVDS